MILHYTLDSEAPEPRRAHPDDAGIDIAISEAVTIPVGEHRQAHTGLHIDVPERHVGMIFVRSSTGIKHHIVLSNGTGIIDPGYTGEIILSLHNTGNHAVTLKAGQRVAQLLIIPIAAPHLARINTLEETARGDRGIGSTGQ